MPLPITHALVPIAAALGTRGRQMPWRLVGAASIASALPDIDSVLGTVWKLPAGTSLLPFWWHRGASHSLFVAIGVGLVAATLHTHLKVRPLVAAVVVGAAMASHGILDMLADQGVPIAYMWPLSSQRFFAEWRPIHSGPIGPSFMPAQIMARVRTETLQLILPMFAIAVLIRGILALSRSIRSR